MKSCTCLWFAKKEKYTKYLGYFHKFFSPGLLNLGAQITCASNQYTTVQMDLKYPQQI